jgi:hypothetical protein
MTRVIFLSLALWVASCDDDTSASIDLSTASSDLAAPDLATTGHRCGADGVMLSCGAVSGSVACYVCDFSGGAGQCAMPCSLAAPACPAGRACVPLDGDGGAFAVEGSGCAGYGICR